MVFNDNESTAEIVQNRMSDSNIILEGNIVDVPKLIPLHDLGRNPILTVIGSFQFSRLGSFNYVLKHTHNWKLIEELQIWFN